MPSASPPFPASGDSLGGKELKRRRVQRGRGKKKVFRRLPAQNNFPYCFPRKREWNQEDLGWREGGREGFCPHLLLLPSFLPFFSACFYENTLQELGEEDKQKMLLSFPPSYSFVPVCSWGIKKPLLPRSHCTPHPIQPLLSSSLHSRKRREKGGFHILKELPPLPPLSFSRMCI